MSRIYLVGSGSSEFTENSVLDDFCRRKIDQETIAILVWSHFELAEQFKNSLPQGEEFSVIACEKSFLISVMSAKYSGLKVELDVPPLSKKSESGL